MAKDFQSIDFSKYRTAIKWTNKSVYIKFWERMQFISDCLEQGIVVHGGAFDIDNKAQFLYID